MLIKALSGTEGFTTAPAPVSAVSSLRHESAANECQNERENMQARRLRRAHRQSRMATNNLGGWTLRMW